MKYLREQQNCKATHCNSEAPKKRGPEPTTGARALLATRVAAQRAPPDPGARACDQISAVDNNALGCAAQPLAAQPHRLARRNTKPPLFCSPRHNVTQRGSSSLASCKARTTFTPERRSARKPATWAEADFRLNHKNMLSINWIGCN